MRGTRAKKATRRRSAVDLLGDNWRNETYAEDHHKKRARRNKKLKGRSGWDVTARGDDGRYMDGVPDAVDLSDDSDDDDGGGGGGSGGGGGGGGGGDPEQPGG